MNFLNNFTATCAISSAFIMGMFWLIMTADRGALDTYKNQLEPHQQKIMSAIRKHRFKLWVQGLLLGFAVAFGTMYLLPQMSANMGSCAFTAILMGVNYAYYMLSPKGSYMISHLRQEQIPAYLEVKKMMQGKYITGLVLGVIGTFLMSRGVLMGLTAPLRALLGQAGG